MPTVLIITLLVGIISNMSLAHANKLGNFSELQNMQSLAVQAKQLQRPIMLLFKADWCEYCELLHEAVLAPMALSGLYNDYVIVRYVSVDDDKTIGDWQGKSVNKATLAYHLNADLTPTVVFLNHKGKEVAPRIVGIQEITLYTNVIHRNLNLAYASMGISTRIPVTVELLDKQSSRLNTQLKQ